MKKFFKGKKPEEIWIDEEENFEKNYKSDIENGPTRFDRFLKGLRKVFGIAMPVITAVTIPSVLVACEPKNPTPPKPTEQHTHILTHVAATTENCTQDGMREHWDCNDCGKTFADSQGKQEVQKSDLVVNAHHTITHKTEQKATCTADGNIDYFHCSVCGENFLDENGKNRVDLDDTVIASKGHVVGEDWEHDEKGHWKVCGACGQQVDYHAHNFKDYVCTDCGMVDEQNKPLTDEEKTEKVASALENNINFILGKSAIVQNYIAINPITVEGKNFVDILVKYQSSRTGELKEYIAYIEIPLNEELTENSYKNGTIKSTSDRSGQILINFENSTEDDRGVEILKKIDPDGDHDHYDFVSVTIGTGSATQDAYSVYTVNMSGIKCTCVNADTFGVRDVVESSILNGTEGETYNINTKACFDFEFSDNVIYNFDGLLNQTQETAYDILYDGKKVGTAQGNLMNYELTK